MQLENDMEKYRLFTSPAELIGTVYMELGPGDSHNGKHFQPGFVFVEFHEFCLFVDIVRAHYPKFDPYMMQVVPRDAAKRIIADWKRLAEILPRAKPSDYAVLLRTTDHEWIQEEVSTHKKNIVQLCDDLARSCTRFLETGKALLMLGV